MILNLVYHNCVLQSIVEDYQSHLGGLYTWRTDFRSNGGIRNLLTIAVL